eukprot:10377258-Alexandrium_andersonii.AAC.1
MQPFRRPAIANTMPAPACPTSAPATAPPWPRDSLGRPIPYGQPRLDQGHPDDALFIQPHPGLV